MQNSRLLWPTRNQMMKTCGVDVPAAIRMNGGLAFIEARAKCRYCLREGVCRHWLAREGQRGPGDFCPNAAFFQSVIES